MQSKPESRIPVPLSAFVAIGLALVAPAEGQAYKFDAQVAAWESTYLSTPIDLEGRVVDEQGAAIVGAQITLLGWGESLDNDQEATASSAGGAFQLAGLARANVLARIEAPGHYVEIIPVELQRPLDEDIAELEVVLYAKRFDRARLSFTGDVMFARRMLDRDEDGVEGEPGDLLHFATMKQDSAALFRFVEPVLQADDVTVINLETPITDDLDAPHPTKSFVFNAYPESAAALEGVGVDAVTLGNNHVFDYLGAGVVDTLMHLDALGLPWFGAGLTDTDARGNWWATSVGGVDLAMQGFSDFVGTNYGGEALYVIADDSPSKPGALWSTEGRIQQFVDVAKAAQRFAIPIFHGGSEYVFRQTAGMRSDFKTAIQRGAGLVIAHHPHVVHGVGTYDGGQGRRFVLGSLGNFVFDQRLYETFLSYIAVVDLEQGASGVRVDRLRLVPIHIDGYIPRMLTGTGVAELGRYVAHLSTAEQLAGGLIRAVVFAEQNGRLVVLTSEASALTSDLVDKRVVPISSGSTGPVALMPFSTNDALARVASKPNATCELGRDTLLYGDFEDRDVDDVAAEGDRWEQTSARYVQRVVVRTGQAAAVLLRSSTNTTRASLVTSARPPALPGRKYTIIAWVKGQNAGKLEVVVRWVKLDGTTISSTIPYTKAAGTWDWRRFTINLTAPANTDSVEITYRQSPPASGEGQVFLDDVELVEWDTKTIASTSTGISVTTPNGYDHVRCAAAGSQLELTLTHRVYETP